MPNTTTTKKKDGRQQQQQQQQIKVVENESKHHNMKANSATTITLSSSSPAISEPRAGGEVSWSSSDGSTYDTEDDLIDQLGHRDPEKKAAILQPDLTIQENKEELDVNDTLPPTTTTTGRPKSRLLRPFSRTNPKDLSKHIEEDTKLLVKQPQQSRRTGKRNPIISDKKRLCVLEDVDVYDDIEVSSNKEDLSTVCFLSKEETAEVFTKQVVPLDVFLKNNNASACGIYMVDELSAISSSIKGSTSIDNGSDLSVRVVHGRTRNGLIKIDAVQNVLDSDERVINAVLGISNHSAKKNSQIDYVQLSMSSQAEDECLLETISISCQQTVSSLESSLTWDSQQDGNNSNNYEEGNGSEDAVRGPLKTTKIQPPPLPPPQPLTVASVRNTEQFDATMNERIMKLKAKIKSMQQTSGLEKIVDEESPAVIESDFRRRHSKEMDGNGEVFDNCVLTPSTDSPIKNSNSPKRDDIDESTYEASEATPSEITFSPLDLDGFSTQASSFHGHPSTTTCTESEHKRGLERLAEVSCDSADEELSMDKPTTKVPIIIPVDDLEDVSLMDDPSRYDIEGGRLNSPEKSRNHGAQEFFQNTQAKTKVLVKNLLRLIETKRDEFQAKSRSDKIVTVTIAVGLFILFILLMSLIAN
jgi:hypothetical protein